jgi:hypothetical protein
VCVSVREECVFVGDVRVWINIGMPVTAVPSI